jgi:hypothetical protein
MYIIFKTIEVELPRVIILATNNKCMWAILCKSKLNREDVFDVPLMNKNNKNIANQRNFQFKTCSIENELRYEYEHQTVKV